MKAHIKGVKKMNEWLDNELRILREANKDDYGKQIVNDIEELLKLFRNQNHSGMTASFTARLSKRLMNNKPITSLSGKDDEWRERKTSSFKKSFQNKRYSALFKEIDKKGVIRYEDLYIVEVVNESDISRKEYTDSFFKLKSDLKDKLNSEITFPYYPKTHLYKYNVKTKKLEKYNKV